MGPRGIVASSTGKAEHVLKAEKKLECTPTPLLRGKLQRHISTAASRITCYTAAFQGPVLCRYCAIYAFNDI
jgi:hypothetical protein